SAVRADPDAGRADHGGGLLLLPVQRDPRREGRPARRLIGRRGADPGDGHPNREEVPDGADAGLAVRGRVRPERHSAIAPSGGVGHPRADQPGLGVAQRAADMLLRGGGKGTPDEKLSFARGMMDFLEHAAPADSVLAKALADHRAVTGSAKDYYLLHEYLETFN